MGRINPFCRERDFFQRCLKVKMQINVTYPYNMLILRHFL